MKRALVGALLLTAPSVARTQRGALSLDDVVTIAKVTDLKSDDKAGYIKRHCVAFHLDANSTKTLRDAGADYTLIGAVETACYSGALAAASTSPEACSVQLKAVGVAAPASGAQPTPGGTAAPVGSPSTSPGAPNGGTAASDKLFDEALRNTRMSPTDAIRLAKSAEIFAQFNDAMAKAKDEERQRLLDREAARQAWMRAIEARECRLARGGPDTIGFKTPVRADSTVVVFPDVGGVVAKAQIAVLQVPKNTDPYVMYSFFGVADQGKCKAGKNCIFARERPFPGISNAMSTDPAVVFIQFLVRQPGPKAGTGKTKYKVTCTHYGPDAAVIKRAEGTVQVFGGEGGWYQSVVQSDKPWAAGVYGVECEYDGKPFANATYDVR